VAYFGLEAATLARINGPHTKQIALKIEIKLLSMQLKIRTYIEV
jgi:hypothetical protein